MITDTLCEQIDCEIKEYLRDKNARRAFMLYGPWGSGKTTSITEWHRRRTSSNAIMRTFRKKIRPLAYVSAFGVASQEELNERIALEFLGLTDWGKSLRDSKRIGSAIAKAFGGDISISYTVLSRLCRKPWAIIIDDIERASGNIDEIFGAINEYIERHNVKVILICDLKRLREKKDGAWIEKLVDTMIPFPTDEGCVFQDIVRNACHGLPELFRCEPAILEAVHDSKARNYRSIIKATQTYRRLVFALSSSKIGRSEQISKLAYAVVAYGIEYNEENFTSQHLAEIESHSALIGQSALLGSLIGKYKKFNIGNAMEIPISKEFLKRVVFENCASKGAVLSLIQNSVQFSVDAPTEWEVIWRRIYNDSDVVRDAIAEQQRLINTQGYLDTGVVLHVFANKLSLSRDSVIQESLVDVVAEAKRYISGIVVRNDVSFHLSDRDGRLFGFQASSYKGLGYPADVSDPIYGPFQDVASFLVEKFAEFGRERVVEKALELFGDIAINFEACLGVLLADHTSEFHDEFLQSLDAGSIAKQICLLPGSKRFNISQAIGTRLYRQRASRSNETRWVEEVGDCLRKELTQMDPLDASTVKVLIDLFFYREERREAANL